MSCLHIGDFVLEIAFPETYSVIALCLVSANSAIFVAENRQYFGNAVRPDPMKGLKIGFVRLGCVIGVEPKCKFVHFEWFRLLRDQRKICTYERLRRCLKLYSYASRCFGQSVS